MSEGLFFCFFLNNFAIHLAVAVLGVFLVLFVLISFLVRHFYLFIFVLKLY